MKLPDEVKSKVEDLAESLALNKMTAEISLSGGDDHGKKPCSGPACKTGCADKIKEHKDEAEAGNGELISSLQMLLEDWTERDPGTDAGSYYEDLKRVVAEHAGEEEEEEESYEEEDEEY